MDYELVIDLTDAKSQAYMSNIQTLFQHIIPHFNIHDRNKYFTSIQLKCNLNIGQLPDPKLLPTLQDLNDTKPESLNGSLLKFNNIQRPSINQFMSSQKQKNILHKKRMNMTKNTKKSPNSSPSYSSSSNSTSILNNNTSSNSKVKNRTFIQNNTIINDDDSKQSLSLQTSLPSPKHPNNNNNFNNTPPPPSYNEVVTQEQTQPEHMSAPLPIFPDLNNDTDIKLQEQKDAKVAQQLQQQFYTQPSVQKIDQIQSNNNNVNVNQFSLSEAEWKLQHSLLPNDSNNKPETEDNDYAFALKLQETQQNMDEDMKIAMKLQKEEDLRMDVERRRNRYRNPNFIDYGSQPSDYIPANNDIYARRQARINNNYYPHVNNISGTHNEGTNVNARNNRWNPGIDEILLQNGNVPSVFRRILDDDNDDDNSGGDMDEMDEILAAHINMYGLHGLHGHGHGHGLHGRRRRRIDDSWQRLPIRTLNGKDVEILGKSEEKKSCPICMADFKIDDVTRQLPCFHEFHKDCVDKWFHQQNDKGKEASCPLDRKKIKDTANQQI